MIISSVVAVALGIAPVSHDGSSTTISGDYSRQVGGYTQVVDRRGTTYVKGRDARGMPYSLVIDRNGYVEANFAERAIAFQVRDAE